MRFIFLILLFLFKANIFPQVNHVIGIDVGFNTAGGTYNSSDKKFESNIFYYFGYKPFLCKVQIGVVPDTYFGWQTKGFLSLGFSTSLDKIFSCHFTYGLGHCWLSKKEYISEYDPSGQPYKQLNYQSAMNAAVSLGAFINLKRKNILIGIETSGFRETVRSYTFHAVSGNSFQSDDITYNPISLSLTLSYLIKRK